MFVSQTTSDFAEFLQDQLLAAAPAAGSAPFSPPLAELKTFELYWRSIDMPGQGP